MEKLAINDECEFYATKGKSKSGGGDFENPSDCGFVGFRQHSD